MKVKKKMAMLVIENPIDCQACPLTDLSSMSGDKLCLAANMRWIETQNSRVKPEWCPLQLFEIEVDKKPLPDVIDTFAKEIYDR